MVDYFDISQTLQAGMAVWPGDPQVTSHAVSTIKGGQMVNVSSFHMGTHTGTHLDVPLHIDDTGGAVNDVPLQVLIGAARVVALDVRGCIREEDLIALDWSDVKRVLFKTRQGVFDERTFDPGFVHLDAGAAAFIAGKGVLLVGIDAPSVDPFESAALPSHRILLGRGIAIVEGIRLEKVPPGDYELICLPLKLAGMDGAPVRAVLRK